MINFVSGKLAVHAAAAAACLHSETMLQRQSPMVSRRRPFNDRSRLPEVVNCDSAPRGFLHTGKLTQLRPWGLMRPSAPFFLDLSGTRTEPVII